MKKKMKSMKWLAMMLAMLLLLAGCGASAKEESAMDMYSTESAMPEEEYIEEEVAVEEEAGSGVQADELGDPNRKLIKRYYLNVETEEYDKLISYIESSVASTGGYIESSNLSGTSIGGNGSRYAYYVLRVPVSDASSFVAGLEKNANVTNKTEEVDDVTLSYVDTQSRIEALRVEQEALMKMLEQADTLETILGLQSRLTEIRYELESYESQIRSYDNLIEYTTITMDVSEVKRETSPDAGSFSERLSNNFSEGFYELGDSLESFIIWFAGVLPGLLFMLLIVLIVLGIIFLILKVSKRSKDRKIEKSMAGYLTPERPQNAGIGKENKKDE